jgi:hypothetical protein
MLTQLSKLFKSRDVQLFVEEVAIPVAVASALSWFEERASSGFSSSGSASPQVQSSVDPYNSVSHLF